MKLCMKLFAFSLKLLRVFSKQSAEPRGRQPIFAKEPFRFILQHIRSVRSHKTLTPFQFSWASYGY